MTALFTSVEDDVVEITIVSKKVDGKTSFETRCNNSSRVKDAKVERFGLFKVELLRCASTCRDINNTLIN